MPKVRVGLYLGFDFGTKNIGVALGDSLTQTARPLTTISAQNGQPNWDDIAALVTEWAPKAFVVGHPLTPEGLEGHIAYAAKKFANRMQARFNLPSHMCDERMTTQIARRLAKKYPQHSVDALSAVLILEAWLRNA
jgi:putative Holliday junction resolvase